MNLFGKNDIKKVTGILLLGMVLSGLLFLPIRIGKNVNADIPIIGSMEQSAYDYCERTATKVLAVYASAKLADRIISTIQKTEIQVSPVGVGVTLAPGELLAAVNDSIERICTLLFAVVGVMLFAKLSIGMMSFVCLKVFLPAAIIFLIVGMFSRFRRWARPLSAYLFQVALLVWVFFPLASWVNTYIEGAYLDKEYTTIEKELESNTHSLDQLEKSLQKTGSAAVALAAIQKNIEYPDPTPAAWNIPWFSDDDTSAQQENAHKPEQSDEPFYNRFTKFSKAKLAEIATGLYNKVKEGFEQAVNLADNTIDKLYKLFVIFILTTIVLPLFMLLFLKGLFKASSKKLSSIK